MSKLYIFDLNGTLTNTPFVDKMPLAILPGRREKIAELQAAGHICAIACNQGGVAFGFTTEEAATEEVAAIARDLQIELFEIAFGHPKPGWDYARYKSPEHLARRKPEAGMLLALMERTGIGADETIMVGDRDEDKGAAEKAGCSFIWAVDFFGSPGEQLWKIYQCFQTAHESYQDTSMCLILYPGGDGAIGWREYPTSDWATWSRPEEAPGIIDAALRPHKEIQEHQKQEMKKWENDDFDPFLDMDDLP